MARGFAGSSSDKVDEELSFAGIVLQQERCAAQRPSVVPVVNSPGDLLGIRRKADSRQVICISSSINHLIFPRKGFSPAEGSFFSKGLRDGHHVLGG
eukprot:3457076-Heterocapsa_arctica.AAC.1